mgnify:CR=1 FL=1
MKNYIIFGIFFVFVCCMDKDKPSVDLLAQSELFIELQLQSEVQLVGKWSVRRKSPTSRTPAADQTKSSNPSCSIYNFEMLADNIFVIKSIDDAGNYSLLSGKYATYYEDIVVEDEIPIIYLFESIENLVFTPEGVEFDYFPLRGSNCLDSGFEYQAEKEALVVPESQNASLDGLFNNWNLKNMTVTTLGVSQSNFQCEVIRQTFENCFNSNCEIPERISLDLTPYGSYYWKYIGANGATIKIEDAFWKLDETDTTGRSLLIKYDEQTPWLDSYPILIEELNETDLILIESRQDITYTYRLTLNEVESCEF